MRGRERLVGGVCWREDGVRVTRLGCEESVGFERRLSGDRTAAEAIVAAVSAVCNIGFIFPIDEELDAWNPSPKRCGLQHGGHPTLCFPTRPRSISAAALQVQDCFYSRVGNYVSAARQVWAVGGCCVPNDGSRIRQANY